MGLIVIMNKSIKGNIMIDESREYEEYLLWEEYIQELAA